MGNHSSWLREGEETIVLHTSWANSARGEELRERDAVQNKGEVPLAGGMLAGGPLCYISQEFIESQIDLDQEWSYHSDSISVHLLLTPTRFETWPSASRKQPRMRITAVWKQALFEHRNEQGETRGGTAMNRNRRQFVIASKAHCRTQGRAGSGCFPPLTSSCLSETALPEVSFSNGRTMWYSHLSAVPVNTPAPALLSQRPVCGKHGLASFIFVFSLFLPNHQYVWLSSVSALLGQAGREVRQGSLSITCDPGTCKHLLYCHQFAAWP